ncbi:hypothetical protein SDC9_180344 [bioreactor metagenome]|uniref:Uncharacterized protein n=1 Tax=bioreactor metagenome TaxID=1076179 RepID=A0A645H1H8_9ZZZZ
MHIPGANLRFERNAFLIEHGGVQRLIHVLLRGGNIVLEAVWNRAEHIVDNAQNVIALDDRIYDDAHRVNIENLVKGTALNIYLPVDAVDALDASFNVGIGML